MAQMQYLLEEENSELFREINASLRDVNNIGAGEAVELQLKAEKGIRGASEVVISKGEKFECTWGNYDASWFPARIRATATWLLHKGLLGTYKIAYGKGLLTIRCIDRKVAARNRDWTREELALALEMYFRHRDRMPGKKSPEVRGLSNLLGQLNKLNGATGDHRFRNVNGVYLKLMNFSSQDPERIAQGKKGMLNSNSLEEELWNQYSVDQDALKHYCDRIRAAIEELSGSFPSVEDDNVGAEEGKLFIRLHRARERSLKLVRKKKQAMLKKHKALRCEACEFDFLAAYGARGEGFIECHHTEPISTLGDGHVTQLQDLKLLCANCHRIIHRRIPWISFDDLKQLISTSRAQRRDAIAAN